MKRIVLVTALGILLAFFAQPLFGQTARVMPSAEIKNLSGETVNAQTFENDGKPFVVNFWATWCKPCLIELKTIAELYPEWREETGVKFIAVSIDDSRNSRKVAPFIKGRGWEFEVYLDENGDLRRRLGVVNPPHTFLCNGKGEIVWEHNGYAPGDEETLYEKIKELAAEKTDE